MAFDFPASPTIGQEYTVGGITYEWNGYAWDSVDADGSAVPEAPADGKLYGRKNGTWVEVTVPPQTIISDTPPPSPANAQQWWDSSTGDLFIWYNDGTSAQWVQINSVGAS